MRMAPPSFVVDHPIVAVATPTLVGLCVGSILFVTTLAAVSCVCYRRRQGGWGTGTGVSASKWGSAMTTSGLNRKKATSPSGNNNNNNTAGAETGPGSLPLRKTSTAVRSPSSGPAGPVLKKAPSPTGGGPGLGPATRSPTSPNEMTIVEDIEMVKRQIGQVAASKDNKQLKASSRCTFENEKDALNYSTGGNHHSSSPGNTTTGSTTNNSTTTSATTTDASAQKKLHRLLSGGSPVQLHHATSGKGGPKQDPAESDIREKEVTEEKGRNEKNLTNQGLQKLGQLHFRLKYSAEKHALLVTIVRCSHLPAKDVNVNTSDPYVKLQLLPDKQHKVKTRVLRKTLNPVYDEDFTFYGLNPNQLRATTLHFVVLSFDRYSRDDVIGEVVCPLSADECDGLEGQQIAMDKDITPRNLKIRSQGRGELLVSLCHQPAANRLTVVVLKARNLPKMDITGLCDPYVKMYLLYNNQRIAKKKTHVKKRTINPVFNESFVFDVPFNEGLANLSLEFLVLDWDRVTKNEVIGRLELGPKVGGATTQQHWLEVCGAPRRQIAEWHKLRD